MICRTRNRNAFSSGPAIGPLATGMVRWRSEGASQQTLSSSTPHQFVAALLAATAGFTAADTRLRMRLEAAPRAEGGGYDKA